MITAALCQREHSLLLLVDVQSKLVSAMPSASAQSTVEACGKLLRGANELGIPSLVSEQYPKGLGHTVEALQSHFSPFTQSVEKTHFAATSAPECQRLLQLSGRQQIIVCGMEAHVCVLQTCLALLAAEHQVFVPEEAVCSRDPAHRDNALARLRQAGAVITNVESVLFEWLGDAQHPSFKQISTQLIK